MKKILSVLVLSMVSTLSLNVQAETQGSLLTKQWLSLCKENKSYCFLMFEASVSTANFTQTFINQSLEKRGKSNEAYLYCTDAASKYKNKAVFDDFYHKTSTNSAMYEYPLGAVVAHYLQTTFPLPCH